MIQFNRLNKDDHLGNLKNAFDVAEKHLGIPQLLDAEDIDVSKPDEKSVMTYVASYYHTFSKMKAGATGGKRIGNIVMKMKGMEEEQNNYQMYSSKLLIWIRDKTELMKRRDFSNTLEGIQNDFKKFKDYRTVEKPPKYREKVEIEATFFDIQIKRQQLRQAPYVPPEGERPHDIEQAWVQLEKQVRMQRIMQSLRRNNLWKLSGTRGRGCAEGGAPQTGEVGAACLQVREEVCAEGGIPQRDDRGPLRSEVGSKLHSVFVSFRNH